jgi:heptosyltransferase-2
MTAVIDTIADNNDEYPFNYFPKQIHDAKTVLTVASSQPRTKYILIFGGDLRVIGILNQCNVIVGNDGGATNMAKALENLLYIFSPGLKRKFGLH